MTLPALQAVHLGITDTLALQAQAIVERRTVTPRKAKTQIAEPGAAFCTAVICRALSSVSERGHLRKPAVKGKRWVIPGLSHPHRGVWPTPLLQHLPGGL